MAFQTAIQFQAGLGVVGEIFDNGPHRAQPFSLVSGSAANNVIGRAFTVTSEGVAAAGGTGVFAGILANPKVYASLGTSSGTLEPTLTLPNNSLAELVTEGQMIVSLPDAAAIGDLVVFDTAGSTPGALSTIEPGDDLPVGKAFANAVVTRFTVTAAGLAVIQLNTVPVPPVPAA
jgi:hypothetical protein